MALRDIDRRVFWKIFNAVAPRPTPKKNHDERPDVLEDPATDLKDIPLDYFWKRVEEVLPDDWGFMLAAAYNDGKMVYLAEAALSGDVEYRPSIDSGMRETPERAIEVLYYRLRDML